MIRGFLSGAFWGTVVAALGLGTVSQLTPLPAERISAEASAVPRAKPAPVDPVVEPAPQPPAAVDALVSAPVTEEAPMPTTLDPALGASVAEEEEAAAEQASVSVEPATPAAVTLDPPAGSEFAKPLPDLELVLPVTEAAPKADVPAIAPLTPPVSDAATKTDAPLAAPSTGLEAPKVLDAPVEIEVADAMPSTVEAAKLPFAVPGQLVLPQADMAPAQAETPAAPVATEEAEVLLKPLPEILPEPVPEALPEPLPQVTPSVEAEAEVPVVPAAEPKPEPEVILVPDAGSVAEDPALKSAATLEPTPGLKGQVDGVTVGRLPRIVDAPAVAEGEAVPATGANPDATGEVAIDGNADAPPLKKYARTFENPEGKPLFAIILIDTGGADVDRAALASLPFAVTFALDPLAPGAAEASKIYRDAGQEVIMVATGIPSGATASDLEVTFQAHAAALPEAVAVIDTEFGAFQADRPLATQVVPILKAQGRGLISWDRGLNAADQVARREGLASGMVFRKLDGKGENSAAVRRALDRAAFKAAQDGRVMVIGQTLPNTVAALMEWAVEGRAASVALAPVSAALSTE